MNDVRENGWRRWWRGIAAGTVAGILVAGTAATVAEAHMPVVENASYHRESEFVDCPGFTAMGSWDVTRTITTFTNGDGTPVRDIFRIKFAGVIFNPISGESVRDAGVRDFFDELAPDGSILSTIFTYERTNPFVHEAGQQRLGPMDANGDQQLLRQVGKDGFSDVHVAALCAALASG